MNFKGKTQGKTISTIRESDFRQALTVRVDKANREDVYQPNAGQSMFVRINHAGVIQIELFKLEEGKGYHELEYVQVQRYDVIAPSAEISYVAENDAQDYPE